MNRAQRGVAIGALSALALTVGLIAFGLSGAGGLMGHAPPTLQTRLTVAVAASLGPLITLVVAVAAVANTRFFSPADIDGAGLTEASQPVRVRRAILENTVEQTLVALPVYAGLALTLPEQALALPLVLSGAFVVARALFAIGYGHGAAARSLGFALTFYSSVGGLVVLAWRLLSAALAA